MTAGIWTSLAVGAIFGWIWNIIATDAGASSGHAVLIGLAAGIVFALVTASIWIVLQPPPGDD